MFGKSAALSLAMSVLFVASVAHGHRTERKNDNDSKHSSLDINHEREHMKHHLNDVTSKKVEDMTDDELEFHYFKLHDLDGDDRLDGLEILKAMMHDEPDDRTGLGAPVDIRPIVEEVDELLEDIDLNKDGYVTYLEYKWINVRKKRN